MAVSDFSDSGMIVGVFDDKPGGWLPVGEFGKLYLELEAQKARIKRMSELFAVERALWFAAGVAVGALGVVLVL